MNDPYALLGLRPDASDADIRAAWRKAARAHPPEVDPAGFEAVRAAYEQVRDPAALARTLLDVPPGPLPVAQDPYGRPNPTIAATDLMRWLLATGRIDLG